MGQAESRQEQFWEACGFGHTDKVKQFIDEGVDVNWVSKTHDSCPIHVASQGKPEILKLLLEAGCDVNARDERQCTALHHAAMNGFTSCAKLLLDAGAVVNAQDKNQWSALHNAAYWAHADMTDLLLSHKADVTMKNKDERLAIHEVARSKNGDEERVGKTTESLILAGSDVEARAGTDGFSDFTVLMTASYHGHPSVVRQLLQSRCEVNAQSSNKWTALHWASDRSHPHIVELLLENNADTSILGNRGETARDRAQNDNIRQAFDCFIEIKYNHTENVVTDNEDSVKDCSSAEQTDLPHLQPEVDKTEHTPSDSTSVDNRDDCDNVCAVAADDSEQWDSTDVGGTTDNQ